MILRKTLSLTLLLVFISCISFAQNSGPSINVSFDQVKSVLLKGVFCDVEAIGTSSSKVTVVGEITGNQADRYHIEHTFENGHLEVVVKQEGKNKWNWNANLRGNIRIQVPKQVELSIRNSSGEVKAKNLESNGTITLKSSSGDITAEDITGNVEIGASSGDIELQEVKGDINIRTSSGNQKLSDVTGNINSVASSGDTHFAKIQGDIDVVTSSGEINLMSTVGSCKLRASSGDIEGDDVKLTEEADFKTTSGSIEIDFANQLEELSFELTTSSGSLRVGRDKSEKRLLLKQGNIQVKGISSSGDQKYH